MALRARHDALVRPVLDELRPNYRLELSRVYLSTGRETIRISLFVRLAG
jgi:hypothetical protein